MNETAAWRAIRDGLKDRIRQLAFEGKSTEAEAAEMIEHYKKKPGQGGRPEPGE
jgi:hypothetical protein